MKSKAPTVWKLSDSLKRVQLQQIATSIGAPLSGTKPELLTSMQDILGATQKSLKLGKLKKPATHDLRVLSIDMGIRNLAFALLTCETRTSSPGKPEIAFSKPELRQWRRIELFNVEKTLKLGNSLPAATTQLENDTKISPAVLDESFEPPNLAKHAYIFAKYCISLRPTHILIERQRFRTGGHAAVLEWSLRVGMLESMLHATFQTFREEGLLTDTTVEPILPMRINKFWFSDQEEFLSANDMVENTAKQAKLAKITIVHDMLQMADTKDASFSIHPDVRTLADAFISKASHRTRTKKGLVSLEKLDDVSDALLQGLAWLRWQENRMRLLVSPVKADGD